MPRRTELVERARDLGRRVRASAVRVLDAAPDRAEGVTTAVGRMTAATRSAARSTREVVMGDRTVRWAVSAVLVAALGTGLVSGVVLAPANAASSPVVAVPTAPSKSAPSQSSPAGPAPADGATVEQPQGEVDTSEEVLGIDDGASVVPASEATSTGSSTTTKKKRVRAFSIDDYPTVHGVTTAPSARVTSTIVTSMALPKGSGSGRRIVYSGSKQHLWIVAADGSVVREYPVTGRSDRPSVGTYRIYSKSAKSFNPIAEVTFTNMVRFAHGVTGAAIGFHSIPRWYNGKPLQTDTSLGLPLGRGGCIRQTDANADFLYAWSHVGDKVTVIR